MRYYQYLLPHYSYNYYNYYINLLFKELSVSVNTLVGTDFTDCMTLDQVLCWLYFSISHPVLYFSSALTLWKILNIRSKLKKYYFEHLYIITIYILICLLYLTTVHFSMLPFNLILSFKEKNSLTGSHCQTSNLSMKRRPSNVFQALSPSQRKPCWFASGLITLLMRTSWDSDSYISVGNC